MAYYPAQPMHPVHHYPMPQIHPQPVAAQNPVDNLLKPMLCYSDKIRISTDVQDVLRQINSLQPAVGQLVHNDGRTSTLLQLHGTVPIYFKGAQYNIPVTIWIGEKYPLVPPTCYVTPTKDMRIKSKHRHVDMHGMVYLPYLNQWNIKSTLVELITFMSSVFSEDPPVYKHSQPLEDQKFAIEQKKAFEVYHKEPTKAEIEAKKAAEAAEQEAKKREDLIEAVTVKLQKGLMAYNKSITTEIDSLFEKQRMLVSGADKIKAGVDASEKDKGKMLDAIKRVDEQIASIKSWLEANETREKTNVDDLVFLKDTWSTQMVDLVAEDCAIEDTLYQLDRALADERIELADFLREVRKLAHKQFMARALCIKVVDRQREEYTKGAYAQSPAPSTAVTQARIMQSGGPWPQAPPYAAQQPQFVNYPQQFQPQQQFQQQYAPPYAQHQQHQQQQVLVGGYPGARR